MRSFFTILILCIILSLPAYSWDQNDAKKVINRTQKILIQIDNNLELRPYIPYDIYGDALAELLQARDTYNEQNYNKSYYLAAMSSIKLETISLLAEAKKIRAKIVLMERDYYMKNCHKVIYETLLNAEVKKKGDAYRLIILDNKLFKRGKLKNKRGEGQLEKIVEVLNAAPGSSLTIASHTSKTDYKEYSKEKAKVIEKYFLSRGINKERITVYGLGNSEVVETPWGFKHLDCIELIIGGIKEND